ncbi:MAG TPA: amidase family protein, partial [Actinomycetota bacterium]
MSRRDFLKASVAAGVVAPSLVACTSMDRTSSAVSSDPEALHEFRWSESSIDDLQAAMGSGELTALELTRDYVGRIEALDWGGPRVNSIIEVNPDAEAIARTLDQERVEGHIRGPLHGIPIVLKDCIATDDGMETTAGSLALVGSKVPRDAGVVTKLREAGAIILGKANMSEWNAFRGFPSRGGWSGRAGMGLNPYALSYSTGDSSSGSAAAVAANFAVGAVGLETYGSIIMPASLCSVVGLRPTMGLISRSGTIPISVTRDTTGPMTRTVGDLAAMLGVMAGVDPLDPVTRRSVGRVPSDYRRFLDPDGLRGARIGVWRSSHVWKDGHVAGVVEPLISVLED